MMGKLVEFERRAKSLVIRLTAEGREQADEIRAERDKHGIDNALHLVCEHQLCNGWEEMTEADKAAMGALTGCDFILSEEAERDDQGVLLKLGAVYWNPNYAIDDEIEDLLTKGEIVLRKVTE